MPGPSRDKLVPFLDRDPELARSLDPAAAELARRYLRVRQLTVDPGPWRPMDADPDEGIGLLITSGFLARELLIQDSRSLELLGAGDLLRPSVEEAVSFAGGSFRALTRTEIAVLDATFVERAVRFPGLISALFAREVRRSRFQAIQSAIVGVVGVERRLVTTFWTLGERWGQIGPDGVHVPVALSHSDLGAVIGARRPSVTSAMTRLQQQGAIERVAGGWLLHGSPPEVPASK
jgi:CRP/FNR family transcriptional regulator, cyclic AMP receptor protein